MTKAGFSTKDIFFSIIVPVYNVKDYLDQCLMSILCQSYRNFEIILVNDGSTDSSSVICELYANENNNINVINKENGGLSDARNFGLQSSRGDYILFVDSDDYWQGSYILEELNELIKNSKPDMILHEEMRFFSENSINKKNNRKNVHNRSGDFTKEVALLVYYDLYVSCAWDKVIKRDILIQNELYFPVGRKSEDIEWCGKLINYVKTYEIYPKSFYIYRQGRQGSITQSISKQHVFDIYEMIKDGLINNTTQSNLKLKESSLNYWSVSYVVLIKEFLTLSPEYRKLVWLDLVSWKYLLKKKRNIRIDKVVSAYNIIPFVLLPYCLYLYRILRAIHKKYRTKI